MKTRYLKIRHILKFRGKIATTFLVMASVIYIAASNFFVSFVLQNCIDSATTKDYSKLFFFSVLFIFVSILCGFFYYLYGKQRQILAQEVASKMKSVVFHTWLKAKPVASRQFKEGEMVTLLSEDVDQCSNFIPYALMPLLEIVLSFLIGSIYALYYSRLIFFVVVVLAVILVNLIARIVPRVGAAYDDKQECLDEENGFFVNMLKGIGLIRLNNLYQAVLIMYRRKAAARAKAEVDLEKGESLNQLVMENGILIIELTVLFIGVALIKNDSISLGAMIGIWNASIGTLVYPLMDFPNVFNKAEETISSFERIEKILDLEKIPLPIPIKKTSHMIKMNHVTVTSGEHTILNSVSLSLKEHYLYVLEGESGTGKTTFLRTLLGHMKCAEGQILYDEYCGEQYNFNSYFSYMPQGNSMMQISMRENLQMNEKRWENDKVLDLCRRLDVIRCLDESGNGFDGVFGQDLSLSEGQAQRFAFIRAILRDAPFLILDEPFSSLDEGAARKVAAIVNEEKKRRGVVVVTHKYTDFLDYDELLHFEGGELYAK